MLIIQSRVLYWYSKFNIDGICYVNIVYMYDEYCVVWALVADLLNAILPIKNVKLHQSK